MLAKKIPEAEHSKQMEEKIPRPSVGRVPGLFKDELGALKTSVAGIGQLGREQ